MNKENDFTQFRIEYTLVLKKQLLIFTMLEEGLNKAFQKIELYSDLFRSSPLL